MARLRLFLQGVASSYLALGTAIAAALLSVPLALHFLTKEQFALWALLTQIGSYLALIDLGMSPAVGRLLIERKDQRAQGSYGGLIQTGFYVTAAQAGVLLLAGLVLAQPLASLFRIPLEMQATFRALIHWQALITAGLFGTRMFRNLLYAHQRNDLINYTQAIAAIVNFWVLWLALHSHGGINSILWANAAAWVVVLVSQGWWCGRLRLFPSPGAWGRPSWEEFKSLWGYGKDVFITQVGALLIMSAPALVVARQLGLEAVAAWTVGTKAFFLLCNLLWQAFDSSSSGFAEMLVRGEHARLRGRYAELLIVTATLAGVAAVVYAVCNSAFVTLWTRGRILWPSYSDLLLGGWMIIAAVVHATAGFIILTKRIGTMRYVFFVEGAVFLGLASVVARAGGLPSIIAVSLLCSVCFSGTYCLWRINQFFGFRPPEMELRWLVPLGKILLVLVPVGLGAWWVTTVREGFGWLLLNGCVVAGVGGYLWLQLGVSAELRAELVQRIRRRGK